MKFDTSNLTDMLQEGNNSPEVSLDVPLLPPVPLRLSETAPNLPIMAPALETNAELSQPDEETGEIFLKFK